MAMHGHLASQSRMMNNEPFEKQDHARPAANVRPSRRLAKADPITANLRRAYAETLAEPLPDELAALLRSLE